ncbi:MAG TPA: zinc-ribbon domain-containing protein, partial [Anaeromyxobacter sp.]
MIVICTNCQAKFRVADDRIGVRGAKVRCSRCRTIFHVLAEPAPAPEAPHDAPPAVSPQRGMDVDLENPFAGPAPVAAGPASLGADPFAAAGLGVSV